MTHLKQIVRLFFVLVLSSCGSTSYKLIASGIGQPSEIKFNIKHILDRCCGCTGILVNTFQADKLQSQLFIESKEGCPFYWTKFNFHYASNGTTYKVDTLIAVSDSTYQYAITEIDKMALVKIDSFILTQTDSSQYYRVKKIEIKGYRDKNILDNDKMI